MTRVMSKAQLRLLGGEVQPCASCEAMFRQQGPAFRRQESRSLPVQAASTALRL